MTHIHLACQAQGWLVTTSTRRFTLSGGPDDTDQLLVSIAAALETSRSALCTWPQHQRPLQVETGQVTLWWFGGAWYAALTQEAAEAQATIRTSAPTEGIARAWEHPSIELGLPAQPDDRIAAVLAQAVQLSPGDLLRAADSAPTRHRFRPWPLQDPHTGVIRALHRRHPLPEAPADFHHLQAVLPRTELFLPHWQADRIAPAASFDAQQGEQAAYRSAIAHLAGPWSREEPPEAGSATSWARQRRAFLDPRELLVTDPAVAANPNSPLTPFDPDQNIGWVAGHKLEEEQPVWIPFQCVHIRSDPPVIAEPVLAYHNLAGMAAGQTLPEAIERGIAYVISHDAVARWWREASTPPLTPLETPQPLRETWSTAQLDLDLRYVPTRFNATVILAIIRDTSRSITTLGHAATVHKHEHPDQDRIAEAAENATLEALAQHASATDLDDPDGNIRAARSLGAGEAPGLLPYRADRDYLDTAPPRPGNTAIAPRPALIDAMAHLQAGLDPNLQTRLEHRLRRPNSAEPIPAPGVRPPAQVYWVETTPPPLKHNGWHAVRVLIPGCLRLEPAAFPLPSSEGKPEQLPYPGW